MVIVVRAMHPRTKRIKSEWRHRNHVVYKSRLQACLVSDVMQQEWPHDAIPVLIPVTPFPLVVFVVRTV